MKLAEMDRDALQSLHTTLDNEFRNIIAKGLALDLTRGKPSAEQLSLSDGIDGILEGNYTSPSGVDVRNYGGIDGIVEARALGAAILGTPVANTMAGGNSSLTLMHQAMNIAFLFGLGGPDTAWRNLPSVKFICPVPGYDRHFGVCEHLGIEMQAVSMDDNGPDMDAVEQLLREDSTIRGMWCVPKYSNPTGIVYSDEVVQRIAGLGKIAHPDFRVFWDNAYAVHDLVEEPVQLANIHELCMALGTEDCVLQFASTSKITHAGSGVAFVAASTRNLDGLKQSLGFITIGPDKVNQLRHVRFFEQDGALPAHMKKHADIIKPRFDVVLKHLHEAFGDNDLGRWESPEGGYFISFDTRPGLAREVVRLAGEAGVKLTPAGATYPGGKDPNDSNIRIAPTVPSVAQVDEAMQVFVLCVKLASVKQMLAE